MEDFPIQPKPIQEHFPLVDRLHTDVLEERYGPISVNILRQDDAIREVHLVDRQGISRTYALTFYPTEMSPDIRAVDAAIRAGMPIGKAFREAGYAIRKNVVDVYTLEIPTWLQNDFAVQEAHAKARLSEFYARKSDGEPEIYGTVTEVYTPDFRGPVINAVDLQQVSALTEALEEEGFSREEIWHRIEIGNDWSDVQERLDRARQKSLAKLFALKKKIGEHIAH